MFQDDMFPPTSDWRTPRVSELPSFRHAKRVAFDTETRDPHLTTLGAGSIRGDGEVVGFSYAIDGGPRRYVPLSHAGGDNVEDKWQAVGWLRDEAKHFSGELVGSKLSYDLCWMLSMGVSFPLAKMVDIQVAEALIDELAMRYGLEALCAKYNIPGKDEELMRRAAGTYRLGNTASAVKKNLWKLPARYVGAYAEGDVDRPLLIFAQQEHEMERQNLWKAWSLECRTLPALLAIRRRGIRVDFDHLDRVDRYAAARIDLALAEASRHTTYRPLTAADLNRPLVLHEALKGAGIDNPYRTAKGQPSVTKEFLEACPGEIGGAIREAKKWDKMRGTFVQSVRDHQINGRIHCYYNQTKGEKVDGSGSAGAGTYRLSCEDPNLQQQPGRDPEMGPLWRQVYIPDGWEAGEPWCSADFSQQEPRFTTHFAAVMDLPRAREAAERYTRDRSTDNHQMMADLTGGLVKRKAAKEIYLGITYGQGGAKTSTKIGLPTSWACRPPRGTAPYGTVYYRDADPDRYHEAAEAGGFTWECAGPEGRVIIDTLEREVPYLSALAKKVQEVAKQKRTITTYFGHKPHFPVDHPMADDLIRKALNRLIQVSSAGQTKEAVCQLHEAGENVQLQVHDELGGSPGSEAGGRRWAEVMEGTAQLMLPSKVDAEFGRSWGESMLTPSEPAYVNGHAKVMAHMKELGI